MDGGDATSGAVFREIYFKIEIEKDGTRNGMDGENALHITKAKLSGKSSQDMRRRVPERGRDARTTGGERCGARPLRFSPWRRLC